jgi:hypothetical protein
VKKLRHFWQKTLETPKMPFFCNWIGCTLNFSAQPMQFISEPVKKCFWLKALTTQKTLIFFRLVRVYAAEGCLTCYLMPKSDKLLIL